MSDDDEPVVSLGWWIRRRRKALDLTQAALAQQVGCAEVTIRKIEATTMRPSRTIAARLARCLHLPSDEWAVFVEVACGECSADRLPGILPPDASRPQASLRATVAPLPLDRVPSPAPLPPGSRMPLRRNPLFVGRDADLRQVARALTLSETAAISSGPIAAATGMGGIGKTQLACEFVHRYGPFFPGGVFWLSFADPAAVPAEIAACGGGDGMRLSAAFGTLPLDEQVRLVLVAWKEPTARLLVFDNCEDAALLEQWGPTYGGCRVLLTSRRHYWDPALGVQPVPLDVLPRADSLILLRQFRPDLPDDHADLAAIADALGDLPLALHLAGSFLGRYRYAITPAEYRARLHTPTILDDLSLQEAGVSPTRHVQHVARTFEQSYAQLDPADPTDVVAQTLLAHAACFAPGESVPRGLLIQTLELPDDDVERALLAEDALTRLIDVGLLETDAVGMMLRMHRLLVAFVQAVIEHDAAQAAVEATILRVVDAQNDQRNPRTLLAIQPHLRFITKVAQVRADARAAGLCHVLGDHVRQLGGYAEAQGYLEQALAIRVRVLGTEHPDTAASLNNLGILLDAQGQYGAAQSYMEQALAIRVRVLGTDHPLTARCFNNLGVILYRQGQYGAARDYYEQALAIRVRVLGMEHPDTADSFNGLGRVLQAQANYVGAQGYYEQALAIQQRVLGMEHPDIAWSLSNLGKVLAGQGQYREAQGCYEQALAIFQRALGMEHPNTAWSLSNLGWVLNLQRQYHEAQGYYEQALAIQQQVLGMEHPYTARSFSCLGSVLQARGYYAEARGYLEHALVIQERVLGTDHPDTARSLCELGDVLRAQGNVMQARHYLEQALAIFLERLGSQHPDTVRAYQVLAALDSDRTAIAGGSGG